MRLITGLILGLIASVAFGAASPNNTIILAGSSAVITDAAGNTWGLGTGACSATFATGSTGPIVVNGVADPTTCAVVELAYEGGLIWQENTAKNWYSKTSPTAAWSASTATSPIPTTPTYAAQAVLSWVAPTQFTNGTTINVPLTYNVYRGSSATALTKLTSVTGLTYTDPAGSSTPTTWYYAISATCASCTEGAESAVVSDTIAAPALVPGTPTLTVH